MFGEPVGGQFHGGAKSGGAVRAGKGGGIGVQQAVLTEVGGHGKGAVADITAVRAHAGMDERVPHEVGQQRKGFAAVRALEGLLACVRADVVAHVDLLLKGLSADAAHKAALGGVGLAAVVRELQLGREGFWAQTTRKGSFV